MLRTTCLAAVFMIAAQSQAAELTIRIENIRNDAGSVRVALYDTPEHYLKAGKSIAGQSFKAAEGSAKVVFADLPAGTYAAALFHDEDDDGELASNLLGVPTEGIAFSEDASASFGAPDFADAAVTLTADGKAETLARLSY